MEGKRKARNDGDARGGDGRRGGPKAIPAVELPVRGRVRSFPPPFLMKTYTMVDDPETNSIISWGPTNTSFIVWDQIRFTSEILHKYFRHSNFSSFVYQLNNYGFKKISWERFEYENSWFQPGKKHLLKNIKRRNQQHDYDITQQAASYESSDDLFDGMEVQLESLMTEQHTLEEEIQKLNQLQKDMEDHLNTLEETMKVAEREKGEQINQLLVKHFIKNLREKTEESRNEIAKKRKLDDSERKKISLENTGEGDDSRLNVDEEQEQGELMITHQEGKTITCGEDPGNSNQDHKVTTAASEHAVNYEFWKQIMEDDSERENGGDDQADHHHKVTLKLEDLIGSNTTLMEAEKLVERPLDMNAEEGNELNSAKRKEY